MAAILTLDDGRIFEASNIMISGAYYHIGMQVAERPRLRNWLLDLSTQCAPFFDIDIRGLEPEDREEFWKAVRRAIPALVELHGPEILEFERSPSAWCVQAMLQEKDKMDAGEPGERSIRPWLPAIPDEGMCPVDLDSVWHSETELKEMFTEGQEEYARLRSQKVGR